MCTRSATWARSPAAFIGVPFTSTNRTAADNLGDNYVRGVYVVGSTVYAATNGGVSIGTS